MEYISSNKDLNVRDENVSCLCYYRSGQIMRFLKQGLSALHHAADRGHTEICKLLLNNNVDLCAVDHEDQSALDYATICEHKVSCPAVR